MATRIPINKAALQPAVFIDISDKPKTADVVRAGYRVPAPKIDTTKVDQIIGTYVAIPPRELPRVVSQSITAGTRIPQGTAVDLVLAPKSAIPFSIFQNVHASLADRTVDAISPLVDNAAARKTLLTYENAVDVPQAEKDALIAAFRGNDIVVDETRPNTGFQAAFDSVRGAMAFQE